MQILSNKQLIRLHNGSSLKFFSYEKTNVPRRHEPVATDTNLSDTPAVDSGVKQAQVFVRRDSLVADVYL